MAEDTAGDANSLVERLRVQYADRWGVLLDALFSPPDARTAVLNNRFVTRKVKGEALVCYRELSVRQAEGEEEAAASRHTSSGLLTHYLTSVASVLPAAALCPPPDSRVLVLGQPPAGRLLALAQLIFGADPSLDVNSRRRRNSAQLSRCFSDTSPERSVSRLSTDIRAEDGDSPPSCQKGLPAFIYGEQAEQPSPSSHAVGGLMSQPFVTRPDMGITTPADSLQHYWGSLGGFVQALLFRGVRAGCCAVKTKSGDWAEIAEAAAAANEDEDPKGKEANGGTELHALATAAGVGLLETLQPSTQLRSELGQILDNHVPQSVRRNIRLSAPASEDGSWWAGAQADSYDCVVVEAQCVASVSATLRACQSGDASPWPSPAEAALIAREANMVMAGFKALRPGGCLLFCSGSLAWEETEGLIRACCTQLGEEAQALAELRGDSQQIEVLLKRVCAEREGFGWRMLPDLSLEGPLYFSLIRKKQAVSA